MKYPDQNIQLHYDHKKLADIESDIKSEIPIINAMEFKITGYNNQSVQLKVPLAPNKNDKNTAFAGVIFSSLVLCGWLFISQKLKDNGIKTETVIYKSKIVYQKPVRDDFIVTCSIEDKKWQRFFDKLLNKSKNKLTLKISIICKNREVVHFKGTYYSRIKGRC